MLLNNQPFISFCYSIGMTVGMHCGAQDDVRERRFAGLADACIPDRAALRARQAESGRGEFETSALEHFHTLTDLFQHFICSRESDSGFFQALLASFVKRRHFPSSVFLPSDASLTNKAGLRFEHVFLRRGAGMGRRGSQLDAIASS